MKVVQINIFGNLSTGRIAVDLYHTLKESGHDGLVAFSRGSIADDVPHIKFGSSLSVKMDGLLSRLTDKAGFFSKKPTEKLIKSIKEYDPDIIHLHNLHGYYINIQMLFDYLKKSKKPVVWTLHDCWSFTGHCCNFESLNCKKWKTGCHDCELKHSYPASLFRDNSIWNYNMKKRMFNGLNKMVIVTPSEWLMKLAKQSYMKKYPCVVIRNGVDLNTFKPTDGNWISNNKLENKKIVLGVAGTWSPTKGLPDMVKLSEILSDDYKVVVVGVSKKQKEKLPKSVFGIERTYDSKELAEIYTSAYVFVNPSYEDNFPNVNIEALACGTPVITYQTGGGPEIINDEIGRVVKRGNVKALKKMIEDIKPDRQRCIAVAQEFERNNCYQKYLDIYSNIMN